VSRLICLDLASGRRVDIKKKEYKVRRYSPTQSKIEFESVEGEERIAMTMDAFATLLVCELAELIDELDEPDPKRRPSRPCTDLSGMSIHRVIDWQIKICLLRLMAACRASPESKKFSHQYDECRTWVVETFRSMGITEIPTPAAWTIYQDLLKWRRARYSVAAVQKKGVEYSPWETRSAFHKKAADLARELSTKHGHLSGAAVHRMVNERISSPDTHMPGSKSEQA